MGPPLRTLRILLVEDNPGDARLIPELMRDVAYFPFTLAHAPTLAVALEHLDQADTDAVLLDLDLPDSRGLDTLARIRTLQPAVAIVVLSGNVDRELALRAVYEGAQDYLLKGHIDPEMLVRAIRFAVEHKRLSEQQQFLSDASRTLARTLDYDRILDEIVQLPVPLLGDASVLILDAAHGSAARVLIHAADPALGERLQSVPPNTFEKTFLESIEFSSALESELATSVGRLGILRVLRSSRRQPFDLQDERVLRELAGRGSIAIENARLHRELQLALRLRDHVLASASHDLRTPLIGISMQAERLVRILRRRTAAPVTGDLTDKFVSDLDDMRAAAQRGLALIQELVDVARLHAGQELQLSRQSVDLTALVHALLADYRARTTSHNLVLRAPSGPVVGNWDPVRLARVFDNLIGNAVKYSAPRRPIEVEVQAENRDDRKWAVVRVRDHGVGIPASDLGRVFEPFFRAGNVESAVRGAGLGLSGVRRIVEYHGGNVRVESREGVGSTFTVCLPCDA
jgi:signal transduction histidine kinase